MSFAPQLERLVKRFAPPNTTVRVVPVQNRFFGETITVTGLLTGGDLLAALTPEVCDGMKGDPALLRHPSPRAGSFSG